MNGTRQADPAVMHRVKWTLQEQHHSPRQAVTKKVLADALGVSTREIELAVQALRRQGVPIASSCRDPLGYFWARSPIELEGTLNHMRHRLREQRLTIEGLERAYGRRPAQPTLFDEAIA